MFRANSINIKAFRKENSGSFSFIYELQNLLGKMHKWVNYQVVGFVLAFVWWCLLASDLLFSYLDNIAFVFVIGHLCTTQNNVMKT